MYLIGLTGGIASGKSTVSSMLSQLGACIVDADKLSHEIIRPQKPAWQEIVNRFGQDILGADGQIDRKRLGKLVFADSHARSELEKITHPRIQEEAEEAIKTAAARGYDIVVLDAPLLIEAGWHTAVDAVWVVFVDEQTQLSRLMARDESDRAAALARIHAQLVLREKLKFADVVIDNSTSIENTQAQVIQAWQAIKAVNSTS